MKSRYTSVMLAVVATLTLTLIGCSADSVYSDLNREPTAEDTVPADLPDNALDSYDAASVRFVGVVNEKQLFLGRGKEQPLCLLIYSGGSDWYSACGSEMMTTAAGDLEVMVVGDEVPDKEGWTKASTNILVKDR